MCQNQCKTMSDFSLPNCGLVEIQSKHSCYVLTSATTLANGLTFTGLVSVWGYYLKSD